MNDLLRSSPRIQRFTRHLLEHDLPGLPTDRREQTATFAAGRTRALPSLMRFGVDVTALLAGVTTAVLGRRALQWWAATHLPIAGEYVRLLRSLSYAYVFETWPGTDHRGVPA